MEPSFLPQKGVSVARLGPHRGMKTRYEIDSKRFQSVRSFTEPANLRYATVILVTRRMAGEKIETTEARFSYPRAGMPARTTRTASAALTPTRSARIITALAP